jgi:hypothetical protein
MAPCREFTDTAIRREAIDQMFEMTEGDEFQQLCEYGSATIHLTASPAGKNGNDTVQKRMAISNRRNSKSCRTPYQYWFMTK